MSGYGTPPWTAHGHAVLGQPHGGERTASIYPVVGCSGPLPGLCGNRHLTLLGWAPGQARGIRHQGLEGSESSAFAVLWPGGGQTGEPWVDLHHSGAPMPGGQALWVCQPRTQGHGHPLAWGCWGWSAHSPSSREPLKFGHSAGGKASWLDPEEASIPGRGYVFGRRPPKRTRRNSHTQA